MMRLSVGAVVEPSYVSGYIHRLARDDLAIRVVDVHRRGIAVRAARVVAAAEPRGQEAEYE